MEPQKPKINPHASVLSYKYSGQCSACKWLKYHPKEKLILANIDRYNNASAMTLLDFQRIYATDVSYNSLRNHILKHIRVVKKPTATIIVSEDTPAGRQVIKESSPDLTKEQFERTLDEFIDQFDEGLKNRQFKLTVKDGLTALKIKADIISKNKDRKTEILKKMMGARDESGRPPERTKT